MGAVGGEAARERGAETDAGTGDEGDASVHAGIVGWGSDARSRRRDVAGAVACAHGPERHHVSRLCCIPLFLWLLFGAGQPCAAAWLLGVSARPTGSTATSPATSTRCPSSARSSTRPPTVSLFIVCVGGDPHRRVGAHVVRVSRCSRARSSSGGTLALLTLFGMKRFDVTWVGKAGTFVLMFAFPAVPPRPRATVRRRPAAGSSRGSPALPGLAVRVLRQHSRTCRRPAGRSAKGEKPDSRNQQGRTALVKAVIMAGGEGTRLRPLTSNAPEADAAGGQPADDGAHRPAAAQARLRRHRGDGRVPRAEHPDLLR